MNTRRSRFIAIQALLTAVLMGVIVVTLISPKSENPELFAVDVPGAGSPAATGPPSYEPQGARDARGERDGGPGRAEGGPAAGTTGAAAGASSDVAAAGATGAAPASPVSQTPTAPVEGPGGPTGDQYDDTLSRLSDAVK